MEKEEPNPLKHHKDLLAMEQEEFVEYHLFPPIPEEIKNSEEVSSYLKALSIRYLDSLREYTKNYIWHRQSFSLKVKLAQTVKIEDIPAHIYGKVHFGDNIEDEWFVVFLLVELSKKYHGLLINVVDTDGEFLLIEAALHLPKWLNPETSHNRVWLKNGEFNIIPLPSSPAEVALLPATLTVKTALNIVRNQLVNTKVSFEVENQIQSRVKVFPKRAKEYRHTVKCYLPVSVVHVLERCPQLVAPAVEAFYYRDVDAMKDILKMEKFSQTGSQDRMKCMMYMVTFTRHLYAQLLQQEFYPPKIFGCTPPQNDPNYKSFMLGVKLACGFEILYQEGKRKGDLQAPDQIRLHEYNFAGDKEWKLFKHNLSKFDYFCNEKKGSQLYKTLEEKAKKEFLQFKQMKKASEDQLVPPSRLIEELLNEPLSQEYNGKIRADDDESWLDITEDQFNEILVQRATSNIDKGDKDSTKSVFDRMNDFMKNVSSFEGVASKVKSKKTEVNFDVSKFMNVVNETIGNQREDISDSDTDFNGIEEFDSDEELDEEGQKLMDLMREMDAELESHSNITGDFKAEDKIKTSTQHAPVNLDFNLVQNFLQSVASQQGLSGPVTNILGELFESNKGK